MWKSENNVRKSIHTIKCKYPYSSYNEWFIIGIAFNKTTGITVSNRIAIRITFFYNNNNKKKVKRDINTPYTVSFLLIASYDSSLSCWPVFMKIPTLLASKWANHFARFLPNPFDIATSLMHVKSPNEHYERKISECKILSFLILICLCSTNM